MDVPIFWRKSQMDLPSVAIKNRNLDDALRVLKKKVDSSKIMGTLKNRSKFTTTAARRRAKRRIAVGKARKLKKSTR
jgi:ribosomal protein S21